MTTVSCPKCRDQVSVPASAPRSARVRCPLCQEEYELADALAQLPPALIIVSAGVVEEPVLAAAAGAEAVGGVGFDGRFDEGSGREFSANLLDAEPPHANIVSTPTPAFRAGPRPKRKEKSMVGELVKIVLGGVVGIGLAIVILWWAAGVDLGLAPTVNKVSWLRWVLPQKFRDPLDNALGNKEVNPKDKEQMPPQPDHPKPNIPKPNSAGELGSDPRFEDALKTSQEPKASGKFGKQEDPLDVSDPFAPEKGSGEGGELKIESPLLTEPKAPAKKPVPAKTKPVVPSEDTNSEDPIKLLPDTTKPAKSAENKPAEKTAEKAKEKPAAEKPDTEEPKEEKPAEKPKAEKPAEPAETSPKETPTAANLSEGIEAANSAAKAFDAIDATDKEARRTAAVALYSAYAGLARTTEQTNLEDADNAEKLPALRQALAQAVNEPVKLNSIGSLAARKLDETDGDLGILLAGTVKDFKAAGGHFETTLELVKDKRLVTVISAKNPQDSYQIDDQVLILGSIIRDPKEKLAGYKGEATVVVKSGHAMVLPMEKNAE